MLSDEQIKAIAQARYEKDRDLSWDSLLTEEQDSAKEDVLFITSRAIAIQAEQDRRSFTAVAKYIGVSFTSETDVVSEVYRKLDEIMTVFREHSQEIAIAQQIKTLNNLLEKYGKQQEAAPVYEGAVGTKEGRSVRAGVVSDQEPQA